MINWNKYDNWKLDTPEEFSCSSCGQTGNWHVDVANDDRFICECGWDNDNNEWYDSSEDGSVLLVETEDIQEA